MNLKKAQIITLEDESSFSFSDRYRKQSKPYKELTITGHNPYRRLMSLRADI